MGTIDELVDAINFLAEHDVKEGHQLTLLEDKLVAAFDEAEATLTDLDEKMLELHQLGKLLLEAELSADQVPIQEKLNKLIPEATFTDFDYSDVQGEIKSIELSRSLLEEKLEATVKNINQVREIKAVTMKEKEQDQTRKLK